MDNPRVTLVAVVCLVSMLTACLGTGPGATTKRFYRALEDGEVGEAVDMLSSSTLSTYGRDKLMSGMRQVTEEIEQKGGVVSVEIVEEEVKGDLAEVRVRAHYGNGSDETEKVQLIREEGEWKIEPDKG